MEVAKLNDCYSDIVNSAKRNTVRMSNKITFPPNSMQSSYSEATLMLPFPQKEDSFPEIALRSSITYTIKTFNTLPETTPPNVMLTKVLQLGRLNQQLINLVDIAQLLVRLEITSCEFLLDPV